MSSHFLPGDKVHIVDSEYFDNLSLRDLNTVIRAEELTDAQRKKVLTRMTELAAKETGGGTAVKHDAEKIQTELLDPLALEGLAAVLTFGAKKYAAHNWRGGFKWTRLLGALLRHTFAILRGEDNDPESGLPHIDHVGCCWMFLSNMMKTRKDLDDRHKNPAE